MSAALAFQKWTVSTIIKVMERNYRKNLKEILDSPDLTKEDKNRRINIMLANFLPMYNGIMEFGLTVKK